MMPHTVPDGPWMKLGADYFDFDGKKFLLIIDYFSKFMYVEEMQTSTAKATVAKQTEANILHRRFTTHTHI